MDAWKAHCKGQYPREFATPERLRSPILNDDQLTVLIQTYTPGHHCYISAYSFDPWERINNKKLNYNSAVIDTIFIDLDWKDNPEIALYEARLCDWVCRHRGIIPRIYFTGMKGFAIYFDFERTDIEPQFKKQVIRTFIEYIRDKLSLKTLDSQCIDGISRISRIPNTLHHGSGLYCIPLNRDQLWKMDGIKYILDLAKTPAKTPIIINNSESLPRMLLKIQDILKEEPLEAPRIAKTVPFILSQEQPINSNVKGTPCLGVMEIIIGTLEGTRDICLCGLIAGLNLQLQMNKDKILDTAVKWSDKCTPPLNYNLSILDRKVDEIISNQYRPCTFLIRAGIKACKKCPVQTRRTNH
ncbi:hypothetical protein KKH23_09650 [Patescibacteria group bacterium]|nr:hypothetical protein [Patescibacteria group bacterium]